MRAWHTTTDRRITVLAPAELSAYECAVLGVTAAVEASLGPDVVANRVADLASLRLEPLPVARRRFAERLSRLTRSGVRGHVLHADVRDCYGSIRVDGVTAALLALGCHPGDVEKVTSVLRGMQRRGLRGLPIGPDPSAVLANAVLARVDLALRRHRAAAIRWVDDFFIPVGCPEHAERAITTLRAGLARIGLRLAPEKTRLVALDRGRPAGWAGLLGSWSGSGAALR